MSRMSSSSKGGNSAVVEGLLDGSLMDLGVDSRVVGRRA